MKAHRENNSYIFFLEIKKIILEKEWHQRTLLVWNLARKEAYITNDNS